MQQLGAQTSSVGRQSVTQWDLLRDTAHPLRDAVGVGFGSRLGLLCSLLQFLSNCGPFAPCTCKMHKIGEVTKNNVFPNYYAT